MHVYEYVRRRILCPLLAAFGFADETTYDTDLTTGVLLLAIPN